MVKGDVSSLGKQNREFLRSVMRLDKTFFSGDRVVLDFKGDKLTPKDGSWSLRDGLQVDKAFAKLSVLGIIKEAEAFFPRTMMESETVNFGSGRGAEPVKRMQGAIAEVAPKSTTAVQEIVAKMQNYDRAQFRRRPRQGDDRVGAVRTWMYGRELFSVSRA